MQDRGGTLGGAPRCGARHMGRTGTITWRAAVGVDPTARPSNVRVGLSPASFPGGQRERRFLFALILLP